MCYVCVLCLSISPPPLVGGEPDPAQGFTLLKENVTNMTVLLVKYVI